MFYTPFPSVSESGTGLFKGWRLPGNKKGVLNLSSSDSSEASPDVKWREKTSLWLLLVFGRLWKQQGGLCHPSLLMATLEEERHRFSSHSSQTVQKWCFTADVITADCCVCVPSKLRGQIVWVPRNLRHQKRLPKSECQVGNSDDLWQPSVLDPTWPTLSRSCTRHCLWTS